MYWQKKFAQPEVPDEREQLILAIRKEHKDYGYRRLWAQLRKLGYRINRKAVQRIVQKLELSAFLYAQNAQVQLLQGDGRQGCRQSPEPQIQNLYPAPEDHNRYK